MKRFAKAYVLFFVAMVLALSSSAASQVQVTLANPNAAEQGTVNLNVTSSLHAQASAASSQGCVGCPTPTFEAARSFPLAGDANSIVSGDFNNDGKLDIATVSNGFNDSNPDSPTPYGQVWILLGDGAGSF